MGRFYGGGISNHRQTFGLASMMRAVITVSAACKTGLPRVNSQYTVLTPGVNTVLCEFTIVWRRICHLDTSCRGDMCATATRSRGRPNTLAAGQHGTLCRVVVAARVFGRHNSL